MTSDQRSERTGREVPVDGPPRPSPTGHRDGADDAAVEAPTDQRETVPQLSSEELAERRAGERRPAAGISLAAFVGGVTAVAFVVLSLSDGGFAPGVWAQATILVWWVALVALIAGAWPRGGIPGPALVTGLALAGLTALTALSMNWASDAGVAYADTIRAAGYLGLFALAAIAARAGAARQLMAGLAVGLFAVAVIALISRLEPGFTGGPDEALALEVSGGRLSYPLGYWNGLGACMASALGLFVWLGTGAATRVRRALAVAAIPIIVLTLFFTGSRGGVLAAAAAVLALLVVGPRRVTLASVAAIGLGASVPLVLFAAANRELVDGRASEAAAAAGDQLLVITIVLVAITAAVAYRVDRWIAAIHLPVLGARRVATGFVILGVLGLLATDPVNRLKALDAPPEAIPLTAKEETTRFANVGGSGRVQFWDAAVDAMAEEPLRGIGAGGFEYWWNLNGDLDTSVEHAHSLFLESGAELGLGGLALAMTFFVAPAVAGARRRLSPTAWADTGAARGGVGAASALLAAGLVTAAIEWTWDLPAAFVPVIIGAAVLATPPPSRAEREAVAGRPPNRLRVGVATGLFAIAAAVVIVASGALFLSREALDESRAELAAGDARAAADSAREASDLAPFDAEPYLAEAYAETQIEGNQADAREAIQSAEERSDQDWRLWWTEAGLELRANEIGRAIFALNQAEALNPRAPQGLFRRPTALDAGLFRKLYERCCADQAIPDPTDQTPGPETG
jgi:tetratricopeptide (TPR) repeat protein